MSIGVRSHLHPHPLSRRGLQRRGALSVLKPGRRGGSGCAVPPPPPPPIFSKETLPKSTAAAAPPPWQPRREGWEFLKAASEKR